VTVELHTLPNGLRIVVEPMPGLQSASVGLWVSAGGRHERAEQNGIAHFLEHMAFKGTARRSALQIAEEIEDVGGYINAYTSREVTAYYARVLKAGRAAGRGPDRRYRAQPRLRSDRDRDRAWRDPAGDRAGRRYARRHHLRLAAGRGVPGQPLGRTILGPAERVRGFTRGDFDRFVAEHYGPSELILSAAGGVDPEEILRLAEVAFGHLTRDRARRWSPRCSRAARSAW
jgi:predicted Zn-dependent peptidase